LANKRLTWTAESSSRPRIAPIPRVISMSSGKKKRKRTIRSSTRRARTMEIHGRPTKAHLECGRFLVSGHGHEILRRHPCRLGR
jgi:hypothetical protein